MLKSLLAVLLVASASSGARAFALCSQGQSEMSVEGVEGIFCVDGSRICIASVSDGVCPLKQPGLAFGSYCGLVATKVYGCKTLTAQSVTPATSTMTPAVTPAPTTATPAVTGPHGSGANCPNGGAEMSVEGAQGVFCVKGGPLCAADVKSGLCPSMETPRLPLGSYCGIVASGVYGCKVGATTGATTSSATTTATSGSSTTTTSGSLASTGGSTPAVSGGNCQNGGAEMSVEGAQGVFCVKGDPLCSGNNNNGLCPSAESPRLPLGSYCGIVAPGVYGCKITATTSESSTTTTSGSSTTTGATTSVTSSSSCANGEAEMSVESIQGVFCVKGGPLCASDVKNGLCPGVETPRLPMGSYCGVVASGVSGCKVAAAGTATATPQGASSTPKPASSTPAPSSGEAPAPGSNCPVGQSEVSVEAVKGFFCVPGGPICSGSVSSGLCPGKSDRLPIGAYCGVVASGVYGCKISNSQSVATPAQTSSSANATTSAVTPSSANADCPNGGSPMSIVGCPKVFCVKGDACVGSLSTGNCPEADAAAGLPKGSYCDTVRPGVYGCKPIV